jgi:hypothetical protein
VDSVREAIVERVLEAAAAMHSGAGATYDWKGASRWRLTPPQSAGWPYATVLDDHEDQNEQAVPIISRRLRITLGGWHVVRAAKSDGPATAGTRMIADFEHMLLSDRTWGGLAVDTMLIDNDLDVSEAGEPNVLCQVRAEIRYRTHQKDTTEVA